MERFCLYLGFIVLEGKWGKRRKNSNNSLRFIYTPLEVVERKREKGGDENGEKSGGKEDRERWGEDYRGRGNLAGSIYFFSRRSWVSLHRS